ncbi:MAG: hypothetical protein M1280_04245, partial [Actinobacteria bacterium]|nr:hypothetical protein [Actinomycetota bacterium]
RGVIWLAGTHGYLRDTTLGSMRYSLILRGTVSGNGSAISVCKGGEVYQSPGGRQCAAINKWTVNKLVKRESC